MKTQAEVLEKKDQLWTRNFILIALINMAIFIGFNMTTISMPIYVASLEAPDYVTGLVTSLATGAALVIRAFTGVLLDQYGRKKILLIGIAILVVVSFSYLAFPLVGVILFLRLVHGVGWGLSSTSTSTIAADAIPQNRFAEGMGYFALASSVAIAIAPALAISLVHNIGIRPVILIAGSASLLALVLGFLEKTPREKRQVRPKKLSLESMFEKKAFLPAGLMLLINCAFASITTFIALHGQAQGVENISLYFTVYALVTIISRPIIGKIIDRTGFYLPALLSSLAVLVTLILISQADSLRVFALAGVFAGLGIGTGMGTFQTMAVSSVNPSRRGVATSTFLFGLDGGIAIGAALAGVLAAKFGYGKMFLGMSIFPALALLIIIVLGKKKIMEY